jgi:hypothetical protein
MMAGEAQQIPMTKMKGEGRQTPMRSFYVSSWVVLVKTE